MEQILSNVTREVDKLYNMCYDYRVSKNEIGAKITMTVTETKELKRVEPHKAEGIKELCYINIAKPDLEFQGLGGVRNISLAERREQLTKFREKAETVVSELEEKSNQELTPDLKQEILYKLTSTIDAVSLIDNYSIDKAKETFKRNHDMFVQIIAHNQIQFPITYEGQDLIVHCNFYDNISMKEKNLAEYLNIDDEDELVKFVKANVELGDIALVDPKAEDFEPIFANIDSVYEIEQVDK